MLSTASTHVSLLARLADGADSAAWSEFADRYGEMIRSFGLRRGLQPADCDDLVQEVLLALSKAMQNFAYDPEKGRFRGYLKAVTVHAARKISGKKRATGGLVDLASVVATAPAAGETDDEAWDDEWRANHVRRAMRVVEVEFGREQLRAFQRYAGEGAAAREVADFLHLSVNQVYQAKSRILKRLAELVQVQVQEEG